jgi:hypothetical protein
MLTQCNEVTQLFPALFTVIGAIRKHTDKRITVNDICLLFQMRKTVWCRIQIGMAQTAV